VARSAAGSCPALLRLAGRLPSFPVIQQRRSLTHAASPPWLRLRPAISACVAASRATRSASSAALRAARSASSLAACSAASCALRASSAAVRSAIRICLAAATACRAAWRSANSGSLTAPCFDTGGRGRSNGCVHLPDADAEGQQAGSSSSCRRSGHDRCPSHRIGIGAGDLGIAIVPGANVGSSCGSANTNTP